ncbi:MAG: hypothetical protein GY795_16875 [Desulfobacterales bacterium]|nr:hypothetical protein [Desulfobacterales bacterium]
MARPQFNSTQTAGFVKKNTGSVRHMQGFNTQIIITKAHALVGLYDFTKQGILEATEMAVLLEDKNPVDELISWFNDIWAHSEDVKNYKMVLKKFMVRRINDMFP